MASMSFSNVMCLPFGAPDCSYSDPGHQTSTGLVLFGENALGHRLSDAESDTPQSEVCPIETAVYNYVPQSLRGLYQAPFMSDGPLPFLSHNYGSNNSFLPSADRSSLTYSDISSSSSGDNSLPLCCSLSQIAPELPSPPASYRESDSESESEGNGTEDGYRPSPPPQPVNRRRAARQRRAKARARTAPYPSSSHTSAASSPSPSASSSSGSSTAKESHTRNCIATCSPPDDILHDEDGTLRCPVDGCTHVVRPKDPHSKPRLADMRRHVSTHFPALKQGKWVCRGYALEVADRLGVPGEIHYVDGVLSRGGCNQHFSRKDSLKRHLKAVCRKVHD
ncbi:hypothetical protein GLOTRDRAFT_89653 [Gloeophyllum trabeum ATCC 11539]|uniref:Uncharacterized protein n=1 Tax=Gloeophyllum trabeum (strain ATCC 11539 / FP-39264 / Madison 617) TaxID=670483 RepID=S7QL60_GLOTA|nr:uncharacterized protein GLOTRDRAFT_89653 [Gloeophyllum trabeum ATCC 11539]EPQ60018.1 hypothetical protein GLOTRDRAFT_89653 [Gloeophyllum trabeum ATCC 11539]